MKKRGYVVLGLHKEGHNALGVIENSLSMNVSENYVRVFKSFKRDKFDDEHKRRTYNLLKQSAEKYQSLYPDYDFRVYRVGSKNIPVGLDWSDIVKTKKKVNVNKYYVRNLPFKLKTKI